MLIKRKSFPSWIIFFGWLVYSFLIAFSIWIQVYSQELKSLIFYREISNKAVFYSLIEYLVISFVVLGFVNIILLVFRDSRRQKSFNWISSLSGQTKAMWPILLLFFYPLRVFVKIGSESAWIQDQTGFYFLVYFILILGWAMYRLVKEIDLAGQTFLKGREINKFVSNEIKITLIFFFISFILFFGYFSILRLQDLTIEKPDIHAYITVLWNTAHGNFLRYTYLGGPRNWFGLHFEPLIFLFVPLYLIKIPEILAPGLLQLIQVIVGASGIFPVFFLARKKLGSGFLGLVFGLVFLLFPAFQFQILYDFHIEIISLVSILWSIYFLELKRYKLFFIFLVLAIFSREEFAIYASLFGLYLLFKKESSKGPGILLLFSGVFYLLLVKSVIIPYFGQGDLVPAQVSMFSHLGKNIFQSSITPLSKLEYLLNFIFNQRKIQYLFLMFLPSGFITLLSPLILFSIPLFAINLLLDFDLPSSILWHYQSWLIPVLIWATIDFISKRDGGMRRPICAFVLTSCFLSSLYFGPLNLLNFDLGNTQKGLAELKRSPEIDNIQEVKKIIPQDRPLAVDPNIAPYFADRQDFYLFPGEDNANYIIIPLKALRDYPGIDPSLKKDGYCLRMVSGFLVYRKQEKCENSWDDGIKYFREHVLLQNTSNKIILSQNLVFNEFPLSPVKMDKAGILEVQVFWESDNGKNHSNKIAYLLEGHIVSVSPSVVKIYGSSDGKFYHEISSCSTLPKQGCTFFADVSSLVNEEKKLYLRLYLFADSLNARQTTDVKIEWLAFWSFKLVSDME